MKDIIIASYVLNHAILSSWGYTFDKPLLLISKDMCQTVRFLQKIVSFHAEIANASSSTNNKKPLVIIPLTDRQKIEWLTNLISNSEYWALSGEYSPCLVAVTELAVDSAVSNLFYECYFESPAENFDYLSTVPSSENLPLCAHLIREQSANDGFSPFVAACVFLRDWALKEQSDTFWDELLKFSHSLYEECLNLSGSSVSLLFNDRLDQYIAENPFERLIKLPNVDRDDTATKIFYNSRAVYLSNSLFQSIADPLLKRISEPQIKRSLIKSGSLLTEETKTFMSKMLFIQGEEPHSAKMLKFDIDHLGPVTTKLIKNELEGYTI